MAPELAGKMTGKAVEAGDGDYWKGVVGLAKSLRKVGCILREIVPVYPPENQTQFAINYSKFRIWEPRRSRKLHPIPMANQLVRLTSPAASTSAKDTDKQARGANDHLFEAHVVDTNTDGHVLDPNADHVADAHVLHTNADHVADAHVIDTNADARVVDSKDYVANAITMFQPTIVTDLESIYSVAELVATQVTTAFEVSINTAAGGHQGDGNDMRITVDQTTEPELEDDVPLLARKLVSALLTVGIATIGADISTVLYRPASGVFFGHNKLAYYIILAVIFVVGAAEVMTAIWLARSGAPHGRRRRFSFTKAAICVSIVPFMVVVGINGASVMEG